MIRIRFPDLATKQRALGFLPGRFSFRSFATGLMIVPPEALGPLAVEGVVYSVDGPASPEDQAPDVIHNRGRLRDHFGAVSLGPTSLGNADIDADLAGEYADRHEGT